MTLTTTLVEGGELIRMTRPEAWDWARWCQEPGCENIRPAGYRAPCASVYGFQETDATTMIGWRAACSRKHALAIWRRELGVLD
jgi:hypothetical protein